MAETTDERWRACKDIGTLGPVLAENSDEIDKVFDLLKHVLDEDPIGITRYHAVLSLAKIAPHIKKARPEMVFDIANLIIGSGLKDDYDRVRRGAMAGIWIISEIPSKMGDMHMKVREACMKQVQEDVYDVIQMDCCSLTGKLGLPEDAPEKIVNRLLKPLDDIAARNIDEAVLSDKLLIYIGRFAAYRLDRLENWRVQLPKDMNKFKLLVVQFEHWSYWPQRECLARSLSILGPILTWLPNTLEQVLDMLELLSQDHVWDVRAAACKAFGDICPAPATSGPGSKVKSQNQIRVGPVVWERATPILHSALRDNSPEVQQSAATALLKGPLTPAKAIAAQLQM
jgi:hypothetical protein